MCPALALGTDCKGVVMGWLWCLMSPSSIFQDCKRGFIDMMVRDITVSLMFLHSSFIGDLPGRLVYFFSLSRITAKSWHQCSVTGVNQDMRAVFCLELSGLNEMPGQFFYMKLIISVATIVSLYLSTFNVSLNNHHTSATKFVFSCCLRYTHGNPNGRKWTKIHRKTT